MCSQVITHKPKDLPCGRHISARACRVGGTGVELWASMQVASSRDGQRVFWLRPISLQGAHNAGQACL